MGRVMCEGTRLDGERCTQVVGVRYDIKRCRHHVGQLKPHISLIPQPVKTISVPSIRLIDSTDINYNNCVVCDKKKDNLNMNRFIDQVGKYHDVCDTCERYWKKKQVNKKK